MPISAASSPAMAPLSSVSCSLVSRTLRAVTASPMIETVSVTTRR
jgi:hypothetical protein